MEYLKDSSVQDSSRLAYSTLTQSIHLAIDKIIEDFFSGLSDSYKKALIANTQAFCFNVNILNHSSLQESGVPYHFIILSHSSNSRNICISDCKIYWDKGQRYCLIGNERYY